MSDHPLSVADRALPAELFRDAAVLREVETLRALGVPWDALAAVVTWLENET